MKLSEWIKKFGDCEITEEMEKCIKKKDGKWMPERGRTYYLVGSNGSVVWSLWDGDITDNYRRDFMRIFKTEKEAERYLEIMKVCKEASFEPDWNDNKYNKHYFRMDYNENKVCIDSHCCYFNGEQFLFESEAVAQSLVDKFGEKDIAKYVLGVEVE